MVNPQQAVFMQHSLGVCSIPVTEVIRGWGQYGEKVSALPWSETDKIDRLADLIVSSFARPDCEPFRQVTIVGHADKDWHGASFEIDVSFERARAVRDVLTAQVRKLWADRHMGAAPLGGIE
jgi:hypothetical protein